MEGQTDFPHPTNWQQVQAQGNACLLIIVDSTNQSEYELVGKTVFAALRYWGMPYTVLDIAREGLSGQKLDGYSCVVIAQPRMAGRLAGSRAEKIRDAVKGGVGLVSLDFMVNEYDAPLQEIFGGLSTGSSPVPKSALRTADNAHYITSRRDRGSVVSFACPIEVTLIHNVSYRLPQHRLIETLDCWPVVLVSEFERGKAVQFTLSPEVWLNDVLGHAGGLDDVLWRSIIWAAKKPFVMRAMPPFVTALVDDCSSSYNHFGYVDAFNRHGYTPHLELFLDDVDRVFHQDRTLGARAIKARYDEGLVEIAAHGFTYDSQIYFDHRLGRAYDDDQLAKNFERFDHQFADWGIRPSSFVNAHFGEIGVNALPYLKERGIRFYGGIHPFGEAWFGDDEARLRWEPAPYGQRGFLLDYMPGHPEFFALKAQVEPHWYTAEQRAEADCLWGNTIFWGESDSNDVESAAYQAVKQIKRGLNSLFYGSLYTHEQRIAALSMGELDRFLSLVDDLMSGFDTIPCSLELVAEYAVNLRESRITVAQCGGESGRLACTLEGKASLTTCLQLFEEEGGEVRQRILDVPPFDGVITISS
jgi:hypothetical protein